MENKNLKFNKETKKGLSISFFIFVLIIIIVLIACYFIYNPNSYNDFIPHLTGNIIKSGDSDASNNLQKITLSFNGNYNPDTIKVKSGVPVEITLDSSVNGCYRSFNIPELGISEFSKDPSYKIKFTPTKKGTFKFQCSMGMGTGTLIVE